MKIKDVTGHCPPPRRYLEETTGPIRAVGRGIGSRWRTGSIRRWAEWWRRSLRLMCALINSSTNLGC